MFKVFFNLTDVLEYLMTEGFPESVVYDIDGIFIVLPVNVAILLIN